MAEGKRYFWLKLKDDFFRSKRIKKLRKMAGGDTYVIIYLKMQLMAIKKNGLLEYTGLETDFAEELALDLDEETDDVRMTLTYLLSTGLIETSDNVNFFLPYAVENTGSENAATQRKRDQRTREKAQLTDGCDNVTQMSRECHDDVTEASRTCHVEIEKEIEIESEKEIYPDKEIEIYQESEVEVAGEGDYAAPAAQVEWDFSTGNSKTDDDTHLDYEGLIKINLRMAEGAPNKEIADGYRQSANRLWRQARDEGIIVDVYGIKRELGIA